MSLNKVIMLLFNVMLLHSKGSLFKLSECCIAGIIQRDPLRLSSLLSNHMLRFFQFYGLMGHCNFSQNNIPIQGCILLYD